MPDDWSREEVEAVVADYFAMLALELQGVPFNKAEHNRKLQRLLRNRTRGSVERKHQNISAVLLEFGFPYVDGYKPLGNYQRLLSEVVADRLEGTPTLEDAVSQAVEAPVRGPALLPDILAIEVPRPRSEEPTARVYDQPNPPRLPARRNYLEIEARNHSLGLAGEELVLKFEYERLWRVGERRLADRIEHVSRTKGDHLGYDIHSFEPNGRDRLIEVKTTRFGAMTPFFASRNEVEVSGDRQEHFQLYRVFAFGEKPKLFTLPGALRSSCRLSPAIFSGVPS